MMRDCTLHRYQDLCPARTASKNIFNLQVEYSKQACVYEEATLDILQDHHGCLSIATESIPNSTPPEVSASIKTHTNAVTKAEGKKRNRRKPSDKKNARRAKTELNKEEKKRYMKILERDRRAAADCRA
ncbi:hypothetical protein FOCG_17345 [Fusarium oxysporum f. sp. radicis-lycopersici 26381]|nr:hypothetical protein FOWG_17476 [Fusarium oxysporum f. sp. lycopersici MN25]EXL40071.1 hypothetical protein FOCG_17345 [Fusarium oxysporum f. sp. radicis-lycopersici 26381]